MLSFSFSNDIHPTLLIFKERRAIIMKTWVLLPILRHVLRVFSDKGGHWFIQSLQWALYLSGQLLRLALGEKYSLWVLMKTCLGLRGFPVGYDLRGKKRPLAQNMSFISLLGLTAVSRRSRPMLHDTYQAMRRCWYWQGVMCSPCPPQGGSVFSSHHQPLLPKIPPYLQLTSWYEAVSFQFH